MANVGKIVGITALVGLLIGASYKASALANKLKQATGNINISVSFLRVHGLVGSKGIAQLLNPIIRVLLNLNIKNFSGFDVEVKNIRVRIETLKSGSKDWIFLGATDKYINLSVTDGKEKDETLTLDFKGFATIASVTNKKNRHRIFVTYELKGQALEYISDIDITSPISAYWQKIKGSINSLKGLGSGNLQTAL